MFIDLTKLTLAAGKGGNGVVAWTRKKYIPKGGPCGGDGGRGGSVYFRVERNMRSLESYARKQKLQAQKGADGGSSSKTGKSGANLVVTVPPGTMVKDAATGELLLDLVDEGEEVLFLKGGRGGYGNEHFKSPTQRAPHFATAGKPGEVQDVILELRLIADVGLVGFPNAGKSSFMKAVSRARVKTASYPFTTLSPNLATLVREDKESKQHLTIADIPGIITDAHLNKGLGLEFLRHIARCSVLCFVIDLAAIDGRKPFDDYLALRHELACYDASLLERKQLILLNKCDLRCDKEQIELFRALAQPKTIEISALSCQDQQDSPELEPLGGLQEDLLDEQTAQKTSRIYNDPSQSKEALDLVVATLFSLVK